MSEEITTNENSIRIKKPKWLRVKLPTGENYRKVRALVDEQCELHVLAPSSSFIGMTIDPTGR